VPTPIREGDVAKRKTGKTGGASGRNRQETPLSAECKRLLELVKERCPDLLPRDPLPAGTVGPEVILKAAELQPLVQAAADPDRRGTIVWILGDSELQVHAAKVTTQLGRGLVLVSIPVHCEETGSARIDVPFAVGDDQHPAGMFAATELRPRGPAIITGPWGDALVAYAWKILLTVARGIAEGAGRDADGAGLIPAAFAANSDTVTVLTQARHGFDRVTR
jgi:hypothetical protein